MRLFISIFLHPIIAFLNRKNFTDMKPKDKKDRAFMDQLEKVDTMQVMDERERRRLRREVKKARSRYSRRAGKKEIDNLK